MSLEDISGRWPTVDIGLLTYSRSIIQVKNHFKVDRAYRERAATQHVYCKWSNMDRGAVQVKHKFL